MTNQQGAERKKTDNLAYIRMFFTQFVDCYQQVYTPLQYMTIDEVFRRRYGFCEYILSKCVNYGINIQALEDAKVFYKLGTLVMNYYRIY